MKIGIALIGATGTVGQKVIKMLEGHPLFEIRELVASEKNTGKKYADVVPWRETGDIPPTIATQTLIEYQQVTMPYAISSIPADEALVIEKALAQKGTHVVSNASAYRMHAEIPLLIPEINAPHLELIKTQQTAGKIITNPNCSTVFLALGLHPLRQLGTIEHVSVVTLQAISGAGYPGVPSLDILGNCIPNIGGEEPKIENEVRKILGEKNTPANFKVTVHVNRIPVVDGHTICMHVFFKNNIDVATVEKHFMGLAEQHPELYVYHRDPFRPRPRQDITPFDQRTHIGRIKQGGEPNVIGLVAMGHNLVRGAAGAAILNLELLHQYLENKK